MRKGDFLKTSFKGVLFSNILNCCAMEDKKCAIEDKKCVIEDKNFSMDDERKDIKHDSKILIYNNTMNSFLNGVKIQIEELIKSVKTNKNRDIKKKIIIQNEKFKVKDNDLLKIETSINFDSLEIDQNKINELKEMHNKHKINFNSLINEEDRNIIYNNDVILIGELKDEALKKEKTELAQIIRNLINNEMLKNSDVINDKNIKLIEKKYNEYLNDKESSRRCTTLSFIMDRTKNDVNFIKNIQRKHESECDYYNCNELTRKFPIKPEFIFKIAKDNNCTINLGTKFIFNENIKKFQFTSVEIKTHWTIIGDLFKAPVTDAKTIINSDHFPKIEEFLTYEKLKKCYVTPCCHTIVEKGYINSYENEIKKVILENIKNPEIKEKFEKCINEKREDIVNKCGFFIPLTCLFCDNPNCAFTNEKKTYIDLMDNGIQKIFSFGINVKPFYEEVILEPNPNSIKSSKEELINTIDYFNRVSHYSFEGRDFYEEKKRFVEYLKKI